jgi:hypothetical protein
LIINKNIPLLHLPLEGKMSIKGAVQENDAIKLQAILTTSINASQILEKFVSLTNLFKHAYK